MILVVWQAIYVPVILAFEPVIVRPLWVFDKMVDCIFIMDFILQFNLARRNDEGKIVANRRHLTRGYVTSGTPPGAWFMIDLSASFPFDWVTQPITEAWSYEAYILAMKATLDNVGNGDALGSVKLVKILRLPRLLRLLKLFRLMKALKRFDKMQKFLKYSRYAHLFRLVGSIVTIVVVCHTLCCLWFFVAGPGGPSDVTTEFGDGNFTTNGGQWFQYECIQIRFHCRDEFLYKTDEAMLSCYEHCDLSKKSAYELGTRFWEFYVTSYFAVTAMLTAGENLSPITTAEKLVAFMFILVGSIFMAVVFGEVAVAISNFYARQSRYQAKMEYLFESMKRMGLPPEIERRVYSYYDYIHESHGTLNGETTMFIPELSKKLAAEVLMYLRMDMIHKVPFFQNISPEVVQQLVLKLSLQVFLPKEYVCVRGEVGDEMFFISDGQCEVTIPFKDLPKEKKDEIMKEKMKNALATGKQRKGSTMLSTLAGKRKKSTVGGRERSFVDKGGGNKLPAQRPSMNRGFSTNDVTPSQQTRFSLDEQIMNADNEGVNRSASTGDGGGEAASRIKDRKGSNFLSLLTRKNHWEEGEEEDVLTIPDDKEMVLVTLSKGSHFGEIALILLTKRTANVRAKGFCELCALNRDVYNGVVAVYIEDKKSMEDYIMDKYGNKENVQKETDAKLNINNDDMLAECDEEDDEEESTDPRMLRTPTRKVTGKQNSIQVKQISDQVGSLNEIVDQGVKKMIDRVEEMSSLTKSNKERMKELQGIINEVRTANQEKDKRRAARREEKQRKREEEGSMLPGSIGDDGDGDDDGAAV